MALHSGTHLGPYEILAPIGSGGMGDVYKARDMRLNRTVAIKVSKDNFSERFEREARAVAALNHPHISTLHDVGPNYLVMEYIEGRPLRGPVPVDVALTYGAQICDALDAAHTHNIVHRDLKPANVLVTRSGVKLLDFGLATNAHKTIAAEESTETALTAERHIVGTLHYMSPEQLQGEQTGPPSDIFSFGVVLYEMLTGKYAFDGNSRASVIAAILQREVPSISAEVPPALDRLLRRCLMKDPRERWQSARDLKAELEWIRATGVPVKTSVKPSSVRKAVWLVAVIVGLATAAGLAYMLQRHETAPVLRLTADVGGSRWSRPVLSPDGSQIAFVSGDTRTTELWVRNLSAFDAQKISGVEYVGEPFWSPDSKQIAFGAEGKLHRVDVAGGTRHLVCDLPRAGTESSAPTGSWSPAGVLIFDYGDNIYRVAASGGEATQVTHLDRSRGELRHLMPNFLPDGRHFLFLAVNQRVEESALYLGSLDSSQVHRILATPVGPAYFISGYLLFVRGSTLMAQRFDWKNIRLNGEPISLMEHPYSYAGSFNPVALFSASDNALAYSPAVLPPTQLVWVGRQGQRLSSVGNVAHYTNPALSPDGKHIAVAITNPQINQRDVWILDSSGGAMRLTSDPKEDFNPVWSPDGGRIAFVSDRKGVRDLFFKTLSANSPEQLLLASSRQKAAEVWSPDGKFLVYNESGSPIMAVPVQGVPTPFPVVDGPGFCDQSAISPDGKWIAYRSHDQGQVEIYVQAFSGGGNRWRLSTNGGGEPSWRRDGKELYFARDNQLFAVDINATAAGLEHGSPKLLFTAPFSTEIRRNRYVPAPDGQRFLLVARAEQEGQHTNVVLNWQAVLKNK